MITIEISALPKMANGGHGSWQKKHYAGKAWKELVGYHLLGKAPKIPYKKIGVIFTRCSSSEPDDDGLVHGFKPIRDALVIYGFVIDDRRANMTAEYKWEKAPRGAGKIRIEIFPLDP